MRQQARVIKRASRRSIERLKTLAAVVYNSLYFMPVIIFLAIMTGAIIGWRVSLNALSHDIATSANARVAIFEQSLRSRLASYEQVLRGEVGLFQATGEVTSDHFTSYLGVYKIENNYPAIQAIIYAKVFRTEQLAEVEQELRNQGIANFSLTPLEPSLDEHASVAYVWTTDNNYQAFMPGFDSYADPVRRTAMLEARDTGQTTLSGRLAFAKLNNDAAVAGFTMYTPYYGASIPITVEARRQAIQGYVYASFRKKSFSKDMASLTDTNALGFRITVDGDSLKNVIAESDNFGPISRHANAITTKRAIDLYGEQWEVEYALDRGHLVSGVQIRRPGTILFFGIFSATLISSIILLLIRARSRDFFAQKEQAVELAKDELLSLASHQLRTPATGVKQYVGMVLQGFAGKLPRDQRKLLEKAYASNDRQLRIINEILHLAKIESGRIVLAKQPTILNDLVSDIINEQKPDIDAANHKLKIDLPQKPISIMADTHMLRMAIENILNNSIKYTPSGGKVSVRVHKDKSKAYINISDTGIGIKSEDTDKIFRQFSRLPNEMSQRVGGTGIGLYLAKHLIELHKGSIKVASEPGAGSNFTIELPLKSPTKVMKNLTVLKKGIGYNQSKK
jgi:signal transduction histidine kinase